MLKLAIKMVGVFGSLLLFVGGGFLLCAALHLMRSLPVVGNGIVDPSFYIADVGLFSVTGSWIYVLLGVLILLAVGSLFLAACIIRSLCRTPSSK